MFQGSASKFAQRAVQAGPAPVERTHAEVTTPRRLRTRAASLEQRAAQLLEEAAVLKRAATELEAARDKRAGVEQTGKRVRDAGLTTYLEHHSVKGEMSDPQAIQNRNLAISEARVRDDVVLKAARKKRGWSQNDLATQLGVSSATVGNWRKGDTSIPREHADWFERELGLPATKSTWPGGVRD